MLDNSKRVLIAVLALFTVTTVTTGTSFIPDNSLSQDAKFWKAWGVKPEYQTAGTGGAASIKLTFPDKESSGGITSTQIPVKGGDILNLTFRARGEGALSCHLFQYDADRKIVVKDMRDPGTLGPDWKDFTLKDTISSGTAFLSLNLLFHKTGGWFEISNVRLEETGTEKTVRSLNPRRMGAKGPAACWTFDEGDSDGFTVYDRAGVCSGDLTTGAVFTVGRFGRGVQFDGISGKIVGDEAPVLGQNFTIAAWFKTDYLNDNPHNIVGNHTILGGDVHGCPLFRVNRNGCLTLVRSDIEAVAFSNGVVKPGIWTHVAVTYSTNGKCVFYINGHPAGESTVNHQPFSDFNHVSLGQSCAGGPVYAMKGELDEVRVYDRTLSGGEVGALASDRELPPAENAERAGRRKGTVTLHLKSGAPCNWFTFGKPVVFSPDGGIVPASVTEVKCRVYDAYGKQVAERTASRSEFMSNGWTWSPATPGFYELAFAYNAGGKETPLNWEYNLQTGRGTTKSFVRERQNIAVMPPCTGKRPVQFGTQLEQMDEEMIRIAADMGFSFARIWVYWGWNWDGTRIANPARGVFQWKGYDRDVELLERYGFKDNYMTIWGTPAWASPFPDKKKIDIVASYAAYAPSDMNDWNHFLEAIIQHYGQKIKTWEIWNEEHLPTSTCYWKDSPAKYAELLQNGYNTIKRVQPEATVILGGMGGKRYLPFYRELLKVCNTAPFDLMSMHGSWPGPGIGSYRELEKEFSAPGRPWMSTEWHAILLAPCAQPPSETALAQRMILDLCDHLKTGAGRITLFHMQGQYEKEILPVAFADGSFAHAYGLFRAKPWNEPRLAAAVMRTFMDQIEETLVFRGVSDLDGRQRVLWFEDHGRTMAVIWSISSSPAPLDTRLRQGLAGTKVTSWEGSPVAPDGEIIMHADRMLFVKGIPAELLKSLTPSSVALNPDEQKNKVKVAYTAPDGVYQNAALLKVDGSLAVNEASIRWNESDWKYVERLAPQADGLKARFAVSIDKNGMDLIVEVNDKTFVQNEKPSELWRGDCVEVALDADGSGSSGAQNEFILALSPQGPLIYKSAAATSLGGGIPTHWTQANSPLEFGNIHVKHENGKIRYMVHIDASELYPFVLDAAPAKIVRMSVLVNNNDGKGRAGFLEWGSGIGNAKDPSLYGILKPSN